MFVHICLSWSVNWSKPLLILKVGQAINTEKPLHPGLLRVWAMEESNLQPSD